MENQEPQKVEEKTEASTILVTSPPAPEEKEKKEKSPQEAAPDPSVSVLPPIITVDFIRSISPIALTKTEVDRSVFIRNISINATLKQVYEYFFDFFGKIQKIFIHLDIKEKLKRQICIVVFEKKESYDTCLLHSKSSMKLVDQTIEIHSLRSCLKKKKKGAAAPQPKQHPQQARSQARPRKKVKQEELGGRKSLSNFLSASLNAVGSSVSYVDGKVRSTVKGVDDSMGVTKKVKGIGDGARKSIQRVDTSLGVSKRAKELTDTTAKGFKFAQFYTRMQIGKIDNKLGVSKGAKMVGGAVTEQTKKGLDGLTKAGKALGDTPVVKNLNTFFKGGGVRSEAEQIPVMRFTDGRSPAGPLEVGMEKKEPVVEERKLQLPPVPSDLMVSKKEEEQEKPEQVVKKEQAEESPSMENVDLKTPEEQPVPAPVAVPKKEEKKEDLVVVLPKPKVEEKKEEIDLMFFSPQNIEKDETDAIIKKEEGKKDEDDDVSSLLKFN